MSARFTRGALAAVVVVVLAVAAAAVFLGVFARGWWNGDGGTYAPRHALVRTSITPARSLFGQVLTARADVVVDPRTIDPASVAFTPDFKPFSIRSESRRTLGGLGRATIVRFQYALQCVSRGCVPIDRNRGATAFSVSPSRVTARQTDGGKVSVAAAWPTFGVQSRLTGDDIGLSTPGIDTAFDPPRVTWAVSPDLVGGLAVGAAVLLALGAAWLVASALRRDTRPLHSRRSLSKLSPIERALVLAEHAASQGEVPESRKALERLAVELRRVGVAGRADEAERLAWSQPGPSEERVAELAAGVRSNGSR
jgi:hypothetical protein